MDIVIRTEGRAGRMTLNRPKALNALTADMLVVAEQALDAWRKDDTVEVVIIDAVGEKAFCAGGDIADLYAQGIAGNHQFGRDFWRQEYRLNLKVATYPKPVVVFMQGFTMGGGVGLACHASHRIVGETSQVAMPECGIGLIPDVGGTFLLARGPGAVGAYLGLTGTRMNAADAIYATFADVMVPEAAWDALKTGLIDTADLAAIDAAKARADGGTLAGLQDQIDTHFDHSDLGQIATGLDATDSAFAASTIKRLAKGSPLAQACGLQAIRAAKGGNVAAALQREYRFTSRATQQGDFLEGIRAQIIDRDFAPEWQHTTKDVPQADIDNMMAPLGADDWTMAEDHT
ncbi:enoyl-CoA hydratase/isomerase family protein [Pseudooctadecabacter sp.]|uniref:enoyl-CoA hydratase/isomerase family protein n=1 Tax=Pseudooctadecabacter sp. TaxID=1966338 RepID=UPI0025DA837D|nr:enoyl-CoA hydratase/isomerase family protein [Pseudooctadecabacter sp.]